MNALEIDQLVKTYPNGFEALKGVSLSVEQGDFFALLGPNGAGKTTAISIVSSLAFQSSGSVKVFDADVVSQRSLAKSFIGLVPQEFNFDQFETVINVVVNQAGYYGLCRKLALQRAEKYLCALDLWDKRFSRTRTLSGGMKRRLMIVRALVHEPKLLLLDEPTAGVDIELRRSMWAFIRKLNAQGITIILTTHYLEEAEQLCRNIAIIDKGQIVENTSMRKLLSQLHKETFVLDLAKPVADDFSLAGFAFQKLDECSLEVEVEKSQGMNDLFAQLQAQDVEVSSLRNKHNRLEELFVNLVKNHE